MKTLVIHISGKVYKVGFRFYVKQLAEGFGIRGTVNYTGAHSICIRALGSEGDLDQFISFCRLGPPGSKVHQISINESPGLQFHAFEIIDDEINYN